MCNVLLVQDVSKKITNNPQVKWCNRLQEEPQVQGAVYFSWDLNVYPMRRCPETTLLSQQYWKQANMTRLKQVH